MMNYINALLNHAPMKQQGEFKIGQTVTLDRYNHINDVEKVKVVAYGSIGWGDNERLAYKMDVNGTIITSTGISIMESKDYSPVPDNERHYSKNATVLEREEYWDRMQGIKTC